MFDRLGWQRSLPLQGVCGPVAQLVEQRPFKAWVAGSNPARLTIFNTFPLSYARTMSESSAPAAPVPMRANRNPGVFEPERKILCPPLSIDKEAADSAKALKLRATSVQNRNSGGEYRSLSSGLY